MHTMLGFDMKERRGADGLHFVHALRKDFTAQLPKMFPMLEQTVADELSKEFTKCKTVDGKVCWPCEPNGKTNSEKESVESDSFQWQIE